MFEYVGHRVIREAAERHFTRQISSGREASPDLELQQWLDASPEHRRAYAATRANWLLLEELQKDPDIVQIMAAAQREARQWRAERRRRRRRWGVALAAAASVLVTVLAVPRLLGLHDDFSAGATTLVTAPAERRSEVLADGSTVTLNVETRVQARVDDEVRHLVLTDGEAVFGVRHDPERPFVVRVGRNATVTALGTRFQVRHSGDTALVTLLEGSVRVDRGGQSRVLAVGEQAIIERGGLHVRQVSLEDATSWSRGWMVFRGQPLQHVVAEVNRYAEQKIRIADPAIAELPLSGNFYLGDSASLTAAMAVVLALDVQQDDGDFVLRRQGR